jgi:hypothetical protein
MQDDYIQRRRYMVGRQPGALFPCDRRHWYPAGDYVHHCQTERRRTERRRQDTHFPSIWFVASLHSSIVWPAWRYPVSHHVTQPGNRRKRFLFFEVPARVSVNVTGRCETKEPIQMVPGKLVSFAFPLFQKTLRPERRQVSPALRLCVCLRDGAVK